MFNQKNLRDSVWYIWCKTSAEATAKDEIHQNLICSQNLMFLVQKNWTDLNVYLSNEQLIVTDFALTRCQRS